MSFTISQFSMVQRWRKLRTPGWVGSAMVNGLGALVTGVVLVVIASTKFLEGAWAVLLLIPILVTILLNIRKHYLDVAQQLSLANCATASGITPPHRAGVNSWRTSRRHPSLAVRLVTHSGQHPRPLHRPRCR
jgi:hypothetical protein